MLCMNQVDGLGADSDSDEELECEPVRGFAAEHDESCGESDQDDDHEVGCSGEACHRAARCFDASDDEGSEMEEEEKMLLKGPGFMCVLAL